MNYSPRMIWIGAIALATMGVALWMEPNMFYETGYLLKQANSVGFQAQIDLKKEMETKQQMMNKMSEMEAKKKAVMSDMEVKKKQLMAEFEAKKSELNTARNSLSDEERKANKSYFEEKKQSIMKEFEARKKELQTQIEQQQKSMQSQYEQQKKDMQSQMEAQKANMNTMKQDMEAKMSAVKSEIEAKRKTIMSAMEEKKKAFMTSAEEQKKQLMSEFEAKKAALYDERNSLSDAERKEQKMYFEEKKQQVMKEFETRKKNLQTSIEEQKKQIMAEFEQQQKAMQSQADAMRKDYETQKSTMMKDYQSQKEGYKTPQRDDSNTSPSTLKPEVTVEKVSAACQSTYETIRKERETNLQERRKAWNTFWETNKNTAKGIFLTDSREDVKDITDDMWSQIRLVEKKFLRSLTTNSPISVDTAMSAINTLANNSRDELSEYVQDDKDAAFASFREAFNGVLYANKKSLLSLTASQMQTLKAGAVECTQKIKTILLQPDALDSTNQNQFNYMQVMNTKPAWVSPQTTPDSRK